MKKWISNCIFVAGILVTVPLMPLHSWAKPADPNEIKIDDFEDPSRNGVSPARTNLWGGNWATVTQNSSIAVTYNGPGADSSRYSAGVTGTLRAYGFAIYQSHLSLEGTHGFIPFDAACHGLIGIQFWMKGDGNTYRMGVPSAAVKDGDVTGDWYAVDFTPPAGVWTFYQFPFKSLTRKFGRSAVANLPEHPDGSDVTGIQFYPLKPEDFSYSVDQISFYGSYVPNCSTPATAKQVSTPTITPTFTATYTFTPWSTATPIPTATPRPTPVTFVSSRPTYTPTTLPVILPELTLVPISTPTPRPLPKRLRLKPTSTWGWNPTRTATPWTTRAPILKAAIATPTVAPALLKLLDREQTIQFTLPPANIYVTFGDGPGWYQLKIMDGQDNLIKTIYDHRVVAESDAWVEWDGQDEKGNDMPPGQYFAVFYKDGTALKSLLVIRSPVNP